MAPELQAPTSPTVLLARPSAGTRHEGAIHTRAPGKVGSGYGSLLLALALHYPQAASPLPCAALAAPLSGLCPFQVKLFAFDRDQELIESVTLSINENGLQDRVLLKHSGNSVGPQ